MSVASDKGGWIGIDLGTTNCTTAVSNDLMFNTLYTLMHFYSHITTIQLL